MRKAIVMVNGNRAGVLAEVSPAEYYFEYDNDYEGDPVSLTMPIDNIRYTYKAFPSFFEGLLPEGIMLEGLLKVAKIDHKDYFSQLIATGNDLVGAVTIKLSENE